MLTFLNRQTGKIPSALRRQRGAALLLLIVAVFVFALLAVEYQDCPADQQGEGSGGFMACLSALPTLVK